MPYTRPGAHQCTPRDLLIKTGWLSVHCVTMDTWLSSLDTASAHPKPAHSRHPQPTHLPTRVAAFGGSSPVATGKGVPSACALALVTEGGRSRDLAPVVDTARRCKTLVPSVLCPVSKRQLHYKPGLCAASVVANVTCTASGSHSCRKPSGISASNACPSDALHARELGIRYVQ